MSMIEITYRPNVRSVAKKNNKDNLARTALNIWELVQKLPDDKMNVKRSIINELLRVL